MSKFLELLRDNDRGRVYRTHALRGVGQHPYGPKAGILDNIPCEGIFSLWAIGSTSRRPLSTITAEEKISHGRRLSTGAIRSRG
jgi:hypothetical protein